MSDPWIHRSEKMKCKTCMWYVEKKAKTARGADTPSIGRCRTKIKYRRCNNDLYQNALR